MATIAARPLKNGHLNYSGQIKYIDPHTGLTKFKGFTFYNPENLTGVRAQKAAIAFAENFEKQFRKELLEPREMRSGLYGADFKTVASKWLATRKHKMAKSYYFRASQTIEKLNNYLGDMRFTDIRAYHVQSVFTSLNEYKYERITAQIKESKKSKFNEKILEYGVRKASTDGNIARPTLFSIRKGESVQWDTARLVCNKFGLDVNDYFEKTYEAKGYKKETIMKHKRVLSCVFSYAIQNELVTVNYASSYYLKKVIAGEKPKAIKLLSDDEMERLYEVLDKQKILQSMPIYLMAMLGMRSCEAAGLEWKDIDFEKRTLSINRDRLYLNGEGIITGDTKSEYSVRTLHICDVLLEKLKQCKAYYNMLKKDDPEFKDTDAVFCNIDGSYNNPQYLNKYLEKFLVEANCHKVSCHKLRHGFITMMVENGVNIAAVAKMVGHAKPDITLKIYTDYRKDADNSKDVLDKIFSKLIKPKHEPKNQ